MSKPTTPTVRVAEDAYCADYLTRMAIQLRDDPEFRARVIKEIEARLLARAGLREPTG